MELEFLEEYIDEVEIQQQLNENRQMAEQMYDEFNENLNMEEEENDSDVLDDDESDYVISSFRCVFAHFVN